MRQENFKNIVRQYEKLVFTICYQLVHDYHEAQNLTQETFLSAYQHFDSCRENHIRPWLARIATNKAKDYLKSAYNRRVQVMEDQDLAKRPSARRNPGELYLEQEELAEILTKIHSLKEPYLKVAELYFLEEKSIEEIALLLRRPKKTVQTQLYRGRIQLQAMLKEAYEP